MPFENQRFHVGFRRAESYAYKLTNRATGSRDTHKSQLGGGEWGRGLAVARRVSFLEETKG